MLLQAVFWLVQKLLPCSELSNKLSSFHDNSLIHIPSVTHGTLVPCRPAYEALEEVVERYQVSV